MSEGATPVYNPSSTLVTSDAKRNVLKSYEKLQEVGYLEFTCIFFIR